jgi:hypothetical protein
MYKRTIGFGLAASLIAGAAALVLPTRTAHADGADLTIHNETGTDVDIIIFDGDDSVHKDGKGGKAVGGHLKNKESGTAKVKFCKFSIVLVHGNDAWHKEFHDCKVTDITISSGDK